jgi:hypothetical protein
LRTGLPTKAALHIAICGGPVLADIVAKVGFDVALIGAAAF